MAIVIQQFISGETSGVAFSADPRNKESNNQIIELVHGHCELLVDGEVKPTTYAVDKQRNTITQLQKGDNGIINERILPEILSKLKNLEDDFNFAVDIEWTIKDDDLYLLQIRPITEPVLSSTADKRPWYLSLTPNEKKMKLLCNKVEKLLIPALKKERY